jgi:hypothetical protein
LHQIDRGALPSTRRGFFPAYRMGIGKNSDMVGKILTWWEKPLLGNGTWSEKFPHSRKNFDMVGKRQGGVHEGIINQVILFGNLNNLLALSWSLILSNYNSISSFSVT